MDFLKRTWAEVHLDRLASNIEQISTICNGSDKIMAIVKANAYGHNDIAIAKHCESLGIKHFGVSNIKEAEKLRHNGINGEILILGYTPCDLANELIENNLIQTVFSSEYARDLSKFAGDRKVRTQIKIDTGMSRIGLDASNTDTCVAEIGELVKLSGISVEGIFTHLSVADSVDEEDRLFTALQKEKLMSIYTDLKGLGIKIDFLHSCNSAGASYTDNSTDSICRVGIVMYGLYPNSDLELPIKVQPVMEIKTVVSMVKTIPEGRSISYGRTKVTDRETKVVTLPIGYADGYPRLLSNKGYVLISGEKAPILGRVCMDQMMVDATGIDVKTGDIVTVIGTDGDKKITADDLAKQIGTIGYEIVCNVSKRVPRVIMNDGEILCVEDNY